MIDRKVTSEKIRMRKYRLRWFKRTRVVHNLVFFQDLIVLSLCIALFGAMVVQLGDMFLALLRVHNPQQVISETLVLLILVELFRLLVIYFQKHHISVAVAVEVAIVSLLREVIVRGLLDFTTGKIVAFGIFLLALGILLLILPWSSRISDKIGSNESVETDKENLD